VLDNRTGYKDAWIEFEF